MVWPDGSASGQPSGQCEKTPAGGEFSKAIQRKYKTTTAAAKSCELVSAQADVSLFPKEKNETSPLLLANL
jgi:hypothetical protein